jgi:chemotaxis response regulator CheB
LKKIRILIVDDISDTRESIRRLLQFEPDIEVIGEAGSGSEALLMAEDLSPDIVLMDINMPEMDGIRTTSYGYVNNVEVFMDAADCIITKPGGITVSECLVKNLPMILTNPIPGQEDRNVDFLNSKNAALIISEELPLENAVTSFFINNDLKDKMIENIKEIAKPNAVVDICDFVKEHIQGTLLKMY